MIEITIGIDVSKDHLDVHRLPDGASRRFDNLPQGHKTLLAWIGSPAARVVYEPTGPYHRKLEVCLAQAGMAIVKINPRQARRFAEATGQLAKTYGLDAAMLARMGALLSLEPRPVRNAVLNDLKDLHLAREALVKDRTAARNRAKSISLPLLKRHNEARLRQIEQQIQAVDAAIGSLIASEPVLASRFRILISIPGIAAVTARQARHRTSRARQADRKPRWPGTHGEAVRPVEGQVLRAGRTQTGPPRALHADPRRPPVQPRSQIQIRATRRRGERPDWP